MKAKRKRMTKTVRKIALSTTFLESKNPNFYAKVKTGEGTDHRQLKKDKAWEKIQMATNNLTMASQQ